MNELKSKQTEPTWSLVKRLPPDWHQKQMNRCHRRQAGQELAPDNQLTSPNICSSVLRGESSRRSSEKKWITIQLKSIKIERIWKITCQGAAVRGRPFWSSSLLCRCHCAAPIMHRPRGVHLMKTPRQLNQPPAANNHQSKTDNIVQPAPAFQLHFLCVLPFWLLPPPPLSDDPLLWWLPLPVLLATVAVCLFVDDVTDRRTIVHFVDHLFGIGLKFAAFDILENEIK